MEPTESGSHDSNITGCICPHCQTKFQVSLTPARMVQDQAGHKTFEALCMPGCGKTYDMGSARPWGDLKLEEGKRWRV